MLLLKQVARNQFLVLRTLVQSTRNMNEFKHKAFVNGNWVEAASGKTYDVFDPATESVVAKVPDMDVKDAQAAIDAAEAAFKSWQVTTARQRAEVLRNWFYLLVENAQEIAKTMTIESGKPTIEAMGEVGYGNSFIEFYAEEAKRIRGETVPAPVANRKIIIEKQPIGVVGVITPWNFPHAMITRKASAAIAAGCTVVVKPAEDTPLTAIALAHLAKKAGMPDGLFNVVTCSRINAAAVGNLLCESPQVAGISFTGSTAVGKILYKQCANRIKRIGLELGGNAPFIVFPSANLDKAVQGAMISKFRNCGQTCVSANRFLVQEDIFDQFVSKFTESVKTIKMGKGTEPGVTAGPLINQMQMHKVQDFVEDAVKKGAKVVIGGKPAQELGNLFFQPTILTDIKPDMKVYKEEVFGPVATIIKFNDEEEALTIANNTQTGLAGYFYSEDVSQIFRVSKLLEVGMIGINEGLISCAEAPFGGIKESGIGREGSHHGIDDYTYIKYLCMGNLS